MSVKIPCGHRISLFKRSMSTEREEKLRFESTLFWNKPPERDAPRSVDPLGFDALREAMADTLVPLLTDATQDADEYLWTLVGLRWARESTGSSVDATIFNQGFARFERALKQYWYRFERRRSGGITVVEKLCKGSQPELGRPILVDQRATGLLGNYIVSLRGMGLFQTDSLLVIEDAADRLLMDVNFSPPRSWTSSWGNLKKAFSGIDFKASRRRLGVRLFKESDGAPSARCLSMTFARQLRSGFSIPGKGRSRTETPTAHGPGVLGS